MKKFLLIFLLLSSSLFAKPRVLVSVAPQKHLISRIAEDRILVDVIVPEGVSPHSYEPSPRQTMIIQRSTVWFRIGEGFEKRLVSTLGSKLHIVDQREGIPLLPTCGCCQDIEAYDPHIWLSPSLLKQLACQMTSVLSQHFPESGPYFQANLQRLLADLDDLDTKITALLKGKQGTSILVTHPAFGYFCRDYGLQQISIEQEGKEPSVKQLMDILEQARQADVHSVFLQKQYSMKGGERIAKALGAKVVLVDPYREDVLDNLRQFAEIL
ncbi:MAG: zinc ABC transporter substrate-binding protein [Verrucomicrobia bacterium]|nr:zinc ABC transporter substrate-binding protein [Verrucomicrobiota bacterium]MBS0646585.1 zinc ABC transporter substrate-binding protein [Verrucomicrobiota bacterium]